MIAPKPIIWSIAGNDTGGGAGLSADQRAADAFGVHLCPVVAALTAQNSRDISDVYPVPDAQLASQLAALADDMPPRVIKTGLLANAQQVRLVAEWVDRLRRKGPLGLVVDPVLSASTGAPFADADTLRAFRDLLAPRATLLTPNRREAERLTGVNGGAPVTDLAAKLRQHSAVCVTGGDDVAQQHVAADWLDTPEAAGWLALPRLDTRHTHGTGCTFATSAAAALALGFITADAVMLAKMATALALRHGYAAGQGAGPVWARPGFGTEPELMPFLSWPDDADLALWWQGVQARSAVLIPQEDMGLYALADSAERVQQALAVGVRTLQLRIKAPPKPDDAWRAQLREAIMRSAALCQRAGASLFVNDHAALVLEIARVRDGQTQAPGLHLGQEDLAALGAQGRARITAAGIRLGVSSHSLWELVRARSLAPAYIACGPVWPTQTKDMPWHAQGMDNLTWWVRMAGRPVAAIGGILEPEQLAQAAQTGASGVCVVRGLGNDPSVTVPRLQQALAQGRVQARAPVPALPHPSLVNALGVSVLEGVLIAAPQPAPRV